MFTINGNATESEDVFIMEPLRIFSGDTELSQFEISGTGSIEIRNTGGSSASEGGMGDGGGDEKGAGINENSAGKTTDNNNESFDKKYDPLAPKEDKEKGNS